MGKIIASASMSLDGCIAKAAREIAGERTVAVTAGTVARQCLELGLLDEVAVDLVTVVMGSGRPYFGRLPLEDIPREDPSVCVQGERVTHLAFPTRAGVTDAAARQTRE